MRGTLGRANLGLIAASTLIVSACASMRPYDPGPGRRAAAGVVRDAYLPGEPINVTTLNLSAGVLTGTDVITVSGLTTWSGGQMTGAGVTNTNGGLLLSSVVFGLSIRRSTTNHILSSRVIMSLSSCGN